MVFTFALGAGPGYKTAQSKRCLYVFPSARARRPPEWRNANGSPRMRVAQWGDKRILFQMAAAPEYGPFLQARIQPVMTGIGPVEAAVVMAATLEGMARDDGLPDLVVSLGSAGSARLEHCAVYQASHVAYRDMDASALGFEKGGNPAFGPAARAAACTICAGGWRRPACPPGRMWCRARVTTPSRRIWSIWKALPCCAPANGMACR